MKEDNKLQRNRMLDILKAIAIIAIVVGHSPINSMLRKFVYTFHLMVFFFSAGFGIKRERLTTEEGLYRYLGKYIYKNGKYMVLYCCLLALLHNPFAKMGITEPPFYSIGMILRLCVTSCVFQEVERLAGAMWFLPVLVIGVMLAVSLLYLTEQYPRKLLTRSLIYLGCTALALAFYYKKIDLPYKLQLSILGIPVIFAGYGCKENWDKIEKYVTWYGGIAAAALLLLCLKFTGNQIELSADEIMGIGWFYPITYIGIYFCLALAKLLDRSRTAKLWGYIGSNTFHIMALHFMCFKLLDWVYALLSKTEDTTILAKFPTSGYLPGIVYVIIGTALPLLFVYLSTLGCKQLKKKWALRSKETAKNTE